MCTCLFGRSDVVCVCVPADMCTCSLNVSRARKHEERQANNGQPFGWYTTTHAHRGTRSRSITHTNPQHTQVERHIHTDRQTDKHRYNQSDTHTHTVRQKPNTLSNKLDAHTKNHTQAGPVSHELTHSATETHTEAYREIQPQIHTPRQTLRDTHTYRHTLTHTQKNPHTHRGLHNPKERYTHALSITSEFGFVKLTHTRTHKA